LMILVSERLLRTGSEGVGFLNAAVGFGGVIAAGVTTRLADSPRSGGALAVAVLACGVPLALLSVTRVPIGAYALMAIVGSGTIILDVVCVTLLQRLLSERLVARVFGILDSISVLGILVGSLLAPILVGTVGLRPTLVVVGLFMPVFAAMFAPGLRALDREAAERMRSLEPKVEVLKRLGIFEGASRQALESLAGRLTERRIAQNERVVIEGEPAENFYVIIDGSFDVSAAGELGLEASRVNEMGPGDYFGEIGLLEKIPRTATVTATEDAMVFEISGGDFLDAIGRTPTISGTLLDGIAGRLARTHPTYEPTGVKSIGES
jgi:CRP-like cAMP-binding protein